MRRLYGLLVIIILSSAACGGDDPDPTATLVPTETPIPLPTLTSTPAEPPTPLPTVIIDGSNLDPEATDEPGTEVLVEPGEGEAIPPPINITLPKSWENQYGTGIYEDVLGLNFMPYSAYFGPITDGRGVIIVLWGFSSVSRFNPFDADLREVNLGADGMRLLRLSVMFGCNIGHSLNFDQEFNIGGHTGLGTNFSAVDCPDSPDTRGWYAALNQHDINYAFYAYVEPIEAMDGTAAEELQSILDTVEFFPLVLPEETPEGGE